MSFIQTVTTFTADAIDRIRDRLPDRLKEGLENPHGASGAKLTYTLDFHVEGMNRLAAVLEGLIPIWKEKGVTFTVNDCTKTRAALARVDKVLAQVSSLAADSVAEPSAICPCGISRKDCTYH